MFEGTTHLDVTEASLDEGISIIGRLSQGEYALYGFTAPVARRTFYFGMLEDDNGGSLGADVYVVTFTAASTDTNPYLSDFGSGSRALGTAGRTMHYLMIFPQGAGGEYQVGLSMRAVSAIGPFGAMGRVLGGFYLWGIIGILAVVSIGLIWKKYRRYFKMRYGFDPLLGPPFYAFIGALLLSYLLLGRIIPNEALLRMVEAALILPVLVWKYFDSFKRTRNIGLSVITVLVMPAIFILLVLAVAGIVMLITGAIMTIFLFVFAIIMAIAFLRSGRRRS
jgi:hypothetical protein